MTHRYVLFFIGLLVAGMACDTASTPQPPAPGVSAAPVASGGGDGALIHIPLAGDPATLDPGKMTGVLEGRFAMNAFEGLFSPSHGTGEPVHAVAASHTRSEDGLTWTFTLREDARWSNGDPVTAEDFAFSWRRVLTPGFDADYGEMLEVIEGAAAFRRGEGADFGSVGVKVLGPHKLEVKTREPVPYFLQLLAFYTFYPVHQKSMATHGERWLEAGKLVSNGPYVLTSYEAQQHLVLEKNAHYRDRDKVSIEGIKFHIIPDNSAALNAFKTGKLDIIPGGLPAGKVPALRGMKGFRLDPLLGVYFYRFNVKAHPVLARFEVRRALSLALDREAIVQRLLKGVHAVATGYVPPIEGYTSRATLDYDPTRARELLKEAGFPEGKGFPELKLLFNTSENHKLLAEVVQSVWRRELGITIKLVNTEWKTYLEATGRGNYEIARGGWIGDYNDPDTFLSIMTTDNGNNRTGWSDPVYDGLLKKASAETRPTERMNLLAEAELRLLEASPIVPIYFYRNAQLVGPRVKGFAAHDRDVILVRHLSLSTSE